VLILEVELNKKLEGSSWADLGNLNIKTKRCFGLLMTVIGGGGF